MVVAAVACLFQSHQHCMLLQLTWCCDLGSGQRGRGRLAGVVSRDGPTNFGDFDGAGPATSLNLEEGDYVCINCNGKCRH